MLIFASVHQGIQKSKILDSSNSSKIATLQIMFPSVTAACNLPWPAMGWYCPTLQAFGGNRMLVGSVGEQDTLNPSLGH